MAQFFAALVLALFALAPSVEAAACGAEPSASVQFAVEATAEASAPTTPDQAPDDIDQHACPHGHCHQAAGVLGGACLPKRPPAAPSAQLLHPSSQAPPTLHSALPERPPRA